MTELLNRVYPSNDYVHEIPDGNYIIVSQACFTVRGDKRSSQG